MIDLNSALLKTGELSWYVIKKMGSRYLLLTSSVIYEGFYNERPCDYLDSRANMFLQRKFMALVEHEGLDTSKISNVGFLSTGQYERYVKGRLPNASRSFLLETPANAAGDKISCVLEDGEIGAVSIWDNIGFRPCIYIDSAYLNDMFPSVSTVDELFEEEKRLLKEQEQMQVQERVQEHEEKPAAEMPEEKDGGETVGESSVISHESKPSGETQPEELSNNPTVNESCPEETSVEAVAAETDKQKPAEDAIAPVAEIQVTENADTAPADDISDVFPDAVVKSSAPNVYSVYRYKDEFEGFADIVKGSADEVKELIGKRSAISDFMKNSQGERKKVDINSVMDLIAKQQSRWRWNN